MGLTFPQTQEEEAGAYTFSKVKSPTTILIPSLKATGCPLPHSLQAHMICTAWVGCFYPGFHAASASPKKKGYLLIIQTSGSHSRLSESESPDVGPQICIFKAQPQWEPLETGPRISVRGLAAATHLSVVARCFPLQQGKSPKRTLWCSHGGMIPSGAHPIPGRTKETNRVIFI